MSRSNSDALAEFEIHKGITGLERAIVTLSVLAVDHHLRRDPALLQHLNRQLKKHLVNGVASSLTMFS